MPHSTLSKPSPNPHPATSRSPTPGQGANKPTRKSWPSDHPLPLSSGPGLCITPVEMVGWGTASSLASWVGEKHSWRADHRDLPCAESTQQN